MFFHFRQNNSGGNFHIIEDEGIGINVIIEADTFEAANDKAEQIGLYFGGVADGRDCECCGSRWSPTFDETSGTEAPSIWGEPLVFELLNKNNPNSFVHLKNGTIIKAHL